MMENIFSVLGPQPQLERQGPTYQDRIFIYLFYNIGSEHLHYKTFVQHFLESKIVLYFF